MFVYPNKLNKIFDKLELLNIKPIIIGGYVRDFLLQNLSTTDIDIEVYGLNSLGELENILQEFGDVNSVGKSFGVCKLSFHGLDLDFSLPRLDNKTGNKHSDFEIKTFKSISFKEAALRRDFTINAIGYDLLEKVYLDYYNGISDLKNKTLNAVNDETFQEDALRVLRAIQFSSRLNFTLSPSLFVLCKDMIKRGELNHLSKERVFDEIKKLLLKSSTPSSGFKLLKSLGALEYFKELKLLTKEDWDAILLSLDRMSKLKSSDEKTNIILMLALICYRLNKHTTISFISRLTDDKEIQKRVLSLTQSSLKHIPTNTELYRLAQTLIMRDMLTLSKALYGESFDVLEVKIKSLGIYEKALPAQLQGRDLVKRNIKPSPEFSTILKSAYEAQMREEFSSYEEALMWLDKKLLT